MEPDEDMEKFQLENCSDIILLEEFLKQFIGEDFSKLKQFIRYNKDLYDKICSNHVFWKNMCDKALTKIKYYKKFSQGYLSFSSGSNNIDDKISLKIVTINNEVIDVSWYEIYSILYYDTKKFLLKLDSFETLKNKIHIFTENVPLEENKEYGRILFEHSVPYVLHCYLPYNSTNSNVIYFKLDIFGNVHKFELYDNIKFNHIIIATRIKNMYLNKYDINPDYVLFLTDFHDNSYVYTHECDHAYNLNVIPFKLIQLNFTIHTVNFYSINENEYVQDEIHFIASPKEHAKIYDSMCDYKFSDDDNLKDKSMNNVYFKINYNYFHKWHGFMKFCLDFKLRNKHESVIYIDFDILYSLKIYQQDIYKLDINKEMKIITMNINTDRISFYEEFVLPEFSGNVIKMLQHSYHEYDAEKSKNFLNNVLHIITSEKYSKEVSTDKIDRFFETKIYLLNLYKFYSIYDKFKKELQVNFVDKLQEKLDVQKYINSMHTSLKSQEYLLICDAVKINYQIISEHLYYIFILDKYGNLYYDRQIINKTIGEDFEEEIINSYINRILNYRIIFQLITDHVMDFSIKHDVLTIEYYFS